MTLLLLALLATIDRPCPPVARLASMGRLLQDGDLVHAQELIDSLRESHPACAELMLGAARVSAARGMLEQTYHLLEGYISLVPENPQGYEALGEFFMDRADLAKAEPAFWKALTLRPDSVVALIGLGTALYRQGHEHDAEARQLLQKACQLHPETPRVFVAMGDFLASRGGYGDAAAAFRRAVILAPNNPLAWRYLANALEFAGESRQAEAAYRRGVAANGGGLDPLLPYYYGKFLLQSNRLAESKQNLDKAIELAPGYGPVFYERAKLMMRLDDGAAARAAAERLLALPESDRGILDFQLFNLLTTIYVKVGDRTLAGQYAALAREAQRAYADRLRSVEPRQAGR